MKCTKAELRRAASGDWELCLTLIKDSVKEAMRFCDKFQTGKLHEVTVFRYERSRSVHANAYFHLLCTKLAEKLGIDNKSAKIMLVKRYGPVAEINGHAVTVTLPKGVPVEQFYPYGEWICGDAESDTYVLHCETHTLNFAQFSRLLDGAISDCRAVGIETLTDEELENIYAQADKKNHDSGSR